MRAFLNTGITLATLKLLGTIPNEKEALNNISNGLDITCFISFSAVIGMLEGPQALPALRLAISISICVAVTGKIKKLSGFDVLRYSSDDLITFGIELASRSPISVKCLQKALAIDFVSVISELLSMILVGD